MIDTFWEFMALWGFLFLIAQIFLLLSYSGNDESKQVDSVAKLNETMKKLNELLDELSEKIKETD